MVRVGSARRSPRSGVAAVFDLAGVAPDLRQSQPSSPFLRHKAGRAEKYL